MKKQVKQWLKYAEVDLLSAEKLLYDENLIQSVTFHSHQTVEKSFKALLENKNIRIPKTHDLERLYGLILKERIKLKLDEDILAQINDVYVDSRYPGDAGLIPQGIPSMEKAKEFFEAAKDVYKKVLNLVSG
ncbi:HEPN domain protein [bacterium BMS3Abin03]|nr:HEPN domain protein [bacterium BMS3Abin03]